MHGLGIMTVIKLPGCFNDPQIDMNTCTTTPHHLTLSMLLGMHDEIFHFEIFKNFMEILKYFTLKYLKISWKF